MIQFKISLSSSLCVFLYLILCENLPIICSFGAQNYIIYLQGFPWEVSLSRRYKASSVTMDKSWTTLLS